MATRTPPDQAETIRLTVPARASFAQVARLTVTSVAARADFGYDDVEDLRIAVGEICGILVDDRADARLTLECRIDEMGLVVEARRSPDGPAPEVSELSLQILEAVAEDVVIGPDDASVTLRKARRG